jgi:hypothetical protein
MMNPNTGQGPQIDITSSTALRCSQCGDDTFLPAVKIRKISRILTGTPKDAVVPIDVFLCSNCGSLCEELIPNELRDLFRKERDDVQETPPNNSGLIL